MDDAWTMHGSSISRRRPALEIPFRDRHPAAAACMAHAQLAPSIFCWVWTARFPDFYSASRMRERGGERKTLRKLQHPGPGQLPHATDFASHNKWLHLHLQMAAIFCPQAISRSDWLLLLQSIDRIARQAGAEA